MRRVICFAKSKKLSPPPSSFSTTIPYTHGEKPMNSFSMWMRRVQKWKITRHFFVAVQYHATNWEKNKVTKITFVEEDAKDHPHWISGTLSMVCCCEKSSRNGKGRSILLFSQCLTMDSDQEKKEIITKASTEVLSVCATIRKCQCLKTLDLTHHMPHPYDEGKTMGEVHLNWLVKASSSFLSRSRSVLTCCVMSSKLCWRTLSRSLLTWCRRSSLLSKMSWKYLSRWSAW